MLNVDFLMYCTLNWATINQKILKRKKPYIFLYLCTYLCNRYTLIPQ